MSDIDMMIMEMGAKGYNCAQIVLAGGLRLMGRENPDLLRAASGLAMGLRGGESCGALAGGLCLIGLYTAKGCDEEAELPQSALLMHKLLRWFRKELRGGGAITCEAILEDEGLESGQMAPLLCGELVAKVWERAVGLLMENGLDPGQGREEC